MQDFSCLCKKLCNAHVSHSNWGEGIIRDIDEKYVQIKFSSDQIGLKRFLFPEAFNPSAPDLKLNDKSLRDEFDTFFHSLHSKKHKSSENLKEPKDKNVINAFTEIKEEVSQRNIPYLVHFTRYENIENILKHGLQSRKYLTNNSIKYIFNDEMRLDNCLDFISCSVAFPNYKLFFKNRKNGGEWVVFLLKTDILWRKECFFLSTNAASSLAQKEILNGARNVIALRNMFGNLHLRKEWKLPTFYTTDPQAEILVKGNIPKSDILAICVQNKEQEIKITEQFGTTVPVKIDCDLYKPRCDWEKEEITWPNEISIFL